MRRLLTGGVLLGTFVVGLATPTSAGPLEDQLTACRVEAANSAAALRDEKTARTAYEAKLAELLAEMREQLDRARDQLGVVTQQRDRLQAAAAAKAVPTPPAGSAAKP